MKMHLKDPEQEKAELEEAFRMFDKDGNGLVDKEEIKNVLSSCGQPISDAEVDDIMKQGDTNNDGFLNYEGNYSFF